MKRLASRMGVLAVIVTALTLVTGSAAYADPSVATAAVVGRGTISPGIGAGVNQSVTFGGTATGQFNGTVGSCTISFTGSAVDAIVTATGSGTASCNGAGISVSCSVNFTRVGATVIIGGSCSGTVHGSLNGAFVFVPTSAAPTTSYELAGTVTVVHT